MIKHEIITRSPLRILEKSTHGGVGKGNTSNCSRKGNGKTAVWYTSPPISLPGQKLIHVSFPQTPLI